MSINPRLRWQHLSPLLPILVAACAAPSTAPVAPIPPPPPGLERVIDHPASVATALLGAATLDRSEPPGRLLQFARAGCVLDIYYYPDAKAPAPIARYAEARGRDGKPQSAATCFNAQLAARGTS